MGDALSCCCLLLQSFCLLFPAQRRRRLQSPHLCFLVRRASLLGFASLQRLRCQEPAFPGDSNPGTFRSQGFSLLSGLRLLILPGLFHPGTLLGFSLQSFLLREIGAPLDARSPPAVFASPVHGKAPVSPARAGDPGASQLQGFVPPRSSFSWVWVLTKHRAAALLGFFSSGVSLSRRRAASSGALLL